MKTVEQNTGRENGHRAAESAGRAFFGLNTMGGGPNLYPAKRVCTCHSPLDDGEGDCLKCGHVVIHK